MRPYVAFLLLIASFTADTVLAQDAAAGCYDELTGEETRCEPKFGNIAQQAEVRVVTDWWWERVDNLIPIRNNLLYGVLDIHILNWHNVAMMLESYFLYHFVLRRKTLKQKDNVVTATQSIFQSFKSLRVVTHLHFIWDNNVLLHPYFIKSCIFYS